MTVRQVCALFVRVAGIFLAIATLRTLPSLVANWDAYQRDSAGWISYTILVVAGTAAACMIAFPLTVARNIIGVRSDMSFPSSWRSDEVQSAAISLMGLWIALQGAMDGLYWLIYRFVAFGVLGKNPNLTSLQAVPYSAESIASMCVAGVQVVAGIALMLQATGIAKLIAIARSAPAPSQNET